MEMADVSPPTEVRAPPPPRNLRSPLDRDAPSRRDNGPLLPTSLARRPAPQASKLTALAFFAVIIGCSLFSNYVFGDEGPWWQPKPPHPAPGKPSWPEPEHPIEVPPLDPGLFKRCVDLLPPPKDLYSSRLDKLVAALGDQPAVWVAEPGPSVEYFLGDFGEGSWSQSERPFLVAVSSKSKSKTTSSSGGEVVILTPKFEEERARQRVIPHDAAERITWLSWAESESPYAVLMDHIGERALVVDGGVRSFIASGLAAHAKHADTSKAAEAVQALRERKDEREIGLMRCANQFTLHAIRKTRAKMFLGIRESQTREILYDEMKYLGLEDYSALVLFGENAALPHGSGTDRDLRPSDFVLIDAGGRWGRYMSDITRTFTLPGSKIPDAHREVWEIVRAAQLAPADLLPQLEREDKPHFSWLDDRARETVKKGMAAHGVKPAHGAGPDYTVFTHRLGHGIGLEGHESPYAVQGRVGDREVLPGHVLTFEPGVYIPKGSEVGDEDVRGLGVRLEDVVVVREDEEGKLSVEWLTGPVKEWGDV